MVNVDPQQRSARYVSNTDGAPPTPPPGGYRGAARPRGPEPVFGLAQETPLSRAPRERHSWFGIAVLAAAAVFAVVLLGLLAFAPTNALFSITMLAQQAIVIAGVIAGLFSPRARRLSSAALAVTLLFNVATVGAISSSRSSLAGAYEGNTTPEDKLWQQYPGIKDLSVDAILAQPSLEEVRERTEAMLADVRERLTAEFGYTWAPPVAESLSPVRNGYGGESMLQGYISSQWTTIEPITSVRKKQAVMDVIGSVLAEHQMSWMYSLNDPSSGVDPSVLDKLYGGTDIASQPVWEWYSYAYDDMTYLYANIYDLTLDDDGTFRASREAAAARTGEPVEGLQLSVHADALLSESDVDAFHEAMKKYP